MPPEEDDDDGKQTLQSLLNFLLSSCVSLIALLDLTGIMKRLANIDILMQTASINTAVFFIDIIFAHRGTFMMYHLKVRIVYNYIFCSKNSFRKEPLIIRKLFLM